VISQVLRDSSIEIGADRGLRRPGGVFRHRRLPERVGQQPHSQRVPVASQTPMGSVGFEGGPWLLMIGDVGF
jgi:hypothetical protein